MSSSEKLRILGFIRDDGGIDYSAAVEFLKIVFQDEYLKHLTLESVSREFRDELRKMFDMSFSGVKLSWSSVFSILRIFMRIRRVVAKYDMPLYTNLFKIHSELYKMNIREAVEEAVKIMVSTIILRLIT